MSFKAADLNTAVAAPWEKEWKEKRADSDSFTSALVPSVLLEAVQSEGALKDQDATV